MSYVGAVVNGSRDRSIKVDYLKIQWEVLIITNIWLVKGVGNRRAVVLIAWNTHELCLRNIPSRKIGIDYVGSEWWGSFWVGGHQRQLRITRKPGQRYCVDMFRIAKSQKLRTKNAFIVGQLLGTTSNLTLSFMMFLEIPMVKCYLRSTEIRSWSRW